MDSTILGSQATNNSQKNPFIKPGFSKKKLLDLSYSMSLGFEVNGQKSSDQ
jgi:hypothetical protein